MKKKAWTILTIAMGIFLILIVVGSYFIGFQVFLASTQLVTNEETKGISEGFWQKYDMDYEEFINKYNVEEIEIHSTFDDHMIPADYIYTIESQNSKNNQTVILVHGLGNNRYHNYPLAEYFLDRGYNVITYDQRSSNENNAQYTTFGFWEKYDLIDWINFVEKEAPGQKIGVWGASFGGATAGLAIGHDNIDEKIDFLILDSPVSSMEWMVEEEMRKMEIAIPIPYMTWWGNLVNKTKLGFTYKDADVVNVMKDVKTPVLIINSKLDQVTPYFMGKAIYDSIPESNREIWTVGDSEHCEMWLDYNQEYQNKLDSFIGYQEKKQVYLVEKLLA